MTPTNHPAPESERDEQFEIVLNSCAEENQHLSDDLHRAKAELDAASNACLELAAVHGLATGHGDTVADMIREFSAQICSSSPEAMREALGHISRDDLIAARDAIAAILRVAFPAAGGVRAQNLHWLGDRDAAGASQHAKDKTGCVLYFETEAACHKFMEWYTASPPPEPQRTEG